MQPASHHNRKQEGVGDLGGRRPGFFIKQEIYQPVSIRKGRS
jgi:hypothetical protein